MQSVSQINTSQLHNHGVVSVTTLVVGIEEEK